MHCLICESQLGCITQDLRRIYRTDLDLDSTAVTVQLLVNAAHATAPLVSLVKERNKQHTTTMSRS